MISAVDDDFPANDSILVDVEDVMHKSEENNDILDVHSPRLLKSPLKPFSPNSSLIPCP
jgi:hypothetical protein